jgi:hypothetical protein
MLLRVLVVEAEATLAYRRFKCDVDSENLALRWEDFAYPRPQKWGG